MVDSESLALETYRALLRTSHRLKRSVRPLFARHGLTGVQFGTLTRIPPEGIPLTRLAAMSWADPGNISGVVDRLEREGWVRRERSQEDRRVVLIFLSERGRVLVEELVPLHRAAVIRAMEGLNENELATFGRLLDRLAPPVPDGAPETEGATE